MDGLPRLGRRVLGIAFVWKKIQTLNYHPISSTCLKMIYVGFGDDVKKQGIGEIVALLAGF